MVSTDTWAVFTELSKHYCYLKPAKVTSQINTWGWVAYKLVPCSAVGSK